MRDKQFKVRVSAAEHQSWMAHAKELFDDTRKVSLMIRLAVNDAIRKAKKR